MEKSYEQDVDTVVAAPFIPQSEWIQLADRETVRRVVREREKEEKLTLAEAMEYDNALRATSPAFKQLKGVC